MALTRKQEQEWWAHRAQAHVECGDFGHAKSKPVLGVTHDGYDTITVSCTRCGYRLTYILSARGGVVGYQRKYPDGYLRPKGAGRRNNDRGRVELVTRLRSRRPLKRVS